MCSPMWLPCNQELAIYGLELIFLPGAAIVGWEWLLIDKELFMLSLDLTPLSNVQASDNRFVNASVEFNVKTLMPTYRLMWGTAGESQALAVAEGLGFDTDIVLAAHEIARHADFTSKPGLLISPIALSNACITVPPPHPPLSPPPSSHLFPTAPPSTSQVN